MTRHPRPLVLVPPAALVALAIAAAGCGGTPAEPAGSASVEPALTITAEAISFEPSRLALAAGTPVRILFRNLDEGVPHGIVVALRTSGVEPPKLGETPIITGVDEVGFELSGLQAGPYLFSCPVHPNMQVEVDVR